jgi:hypothetical protein
MRRVDSTFQSLLGRRIMRVTPHEFDPEETILSCDDGRVFIIRGGYCGHDDKVARQDAEYVPPVIEEVVE